MSKIIKLDFKTFTKPSLLYVVLVQFFMFITLHVEEWIPYGTNYILDYLQLFIMIISVVALITLTLLYGSYFIVKSNTNHLFMFELTDGYGLYRFLTTVFMVLLIVLNFVIAGLLNDVIQLKDILELPLSWYVNSVFGWIPLLALVIITIAHTRDKRIFRNKEGLASMTVILVGVYIAGNLFYFDNARQGQAVLFLLFIPIAIMYMSIKDRNSAKKIYKILIFGMCGLVTLGTLYLFTTSDFEYDIGYQYDEGSDEYYDPRVESYFMSADIEYDTIDSQYGKIEVFSEVDTQNIRYSFATDNYTYRLTTYEQNTFDFQASEIGGGSQYSGYSYGNSDVIEIYASIYDEEKLKHIECSHIVEGESECIDDEEVIEVFKFGIEFMKENA